MANATRALPHIAAIIAPISLAGLEGTGASGVYAGGTELAD
jgi:hypothetical protein